ncbi:hypothetical protein Pcinc_029604 [Petrolisthes cinctipes]|uniref:Uncharacterized protein n=1 Tax=Petrolisthes cinctipes TaxID=88211 RepID=A0AAE1F004_PETCI|nr:hypothetical protein Pcinc_029604 [Petrolisthes cinctipes]
MATGKWYPWTANIIRLLLSLLSVSALQSPEPRTGVVEDDTTLKFTSTETNIVPITRMFRVRGGDERRTVGIIHNNITNSVFITTPNGSALEYTNAVQNELPFLGRTDASRTQTPESDQSDVKISVIGHIDLNRTNAVREDYSGTVTDTSFKQMTPAGTHTVTEPKFENVDDGEAKVELNDEGWGSEPVNITTIPIISSHHYNHNHIISTSQPTVDGKQMNLTVEFEVLGRHLVLVLHPTSDLIAEDYNEEEQDREQTDEGRTCEYQGEVRHYAGSWAALSICGGFRGMMVVGGQQLLVTPLPGSSSLIQPHRIISAHLVSQPGHCGVKSEDMGSGADNHTHTYQQKTSHRERREAEVLQGGQLWVLKTTRFVELVLVADNSFYLRHGANTRARCRAIVNIVNAMYRPLGVVVVLSKLVVWKEKDEVPVLTDFEQSLNNLRDYRENQHESNHQPQKESDNTILLTKVDFTGQTVGYATVAGMCGYRDSVGVVQDSKEEVGVVAQTLAHEMGHNLGMKHDEDFSGCQCPHSACVMSSMGSHKYNHEVSWSSCSKQSLITNIKTSEFDCLKNVPSRAVHQSCGDGVVDVEGGEECDCGPPEFCDNLCCNAQTCQLAVNATCASGSCCNTKTCKLWPQGEVCRPARTDCDLPEFCSGDSEFCQPDVSKANGEDCKTGKVKGHCYEGECQSHEHRCQQVWGPQARVAHSICYDLNRDKGGNTSNCGFTNDDRNYLSRCSDNDKLCGTLHCETSRSTGTILNHHVRLHMGNWKRSGHICRYIIADHNIPDSFWLTPNGAVCGEGKMCVNQHCVDVTPPEGDCSSGCSGRGVCNSRGHCHCDPGFQPPDCTSKGYGGSIDSNPSGRKRRIGPLMDAVLYLCFIIGALLLLLCCLWSCLRSWWEADGRSHTLPCCVTCLDSCCCPLMNKLNNWICSVICTIKKDQPRKQPEPRIMEREKMMGQADMQFVQGPLTKINRLQTHEGETTDRPTYLQSVSVDSGCVLDEEENTTTTNTRPTYTTQMSLTSLISTFRAYRYQSRKGAPKSDNSSSKRFMSQRSLPHGVPSREKSSSWRRFSSKKNVPLSRIILDRNVGSAEATQGVKHRGNMQTTYTHSVSFDATQSSRGEGAPSLPAPHKISGPILPPANTNFASNNNSVSSQRNIIMKHHENDSLEKDNCMKSKTALQPSQKLRISPVRVAPIPPSDQSQSPTPEPVIQTRVKGSDSPSSINILPGRLKNNEKSIIRPNHVRKQEELTPSAISRPSNAGPVMPPGYESCGGKSKKKPIMPPHLVHQKTSEKKPMMPPVKGSQCLPTASSSMARKGLPTPPKPPNARNIQSSIVTQPSSTTAVPAVSDRGRSVKDLAALHERLELPPTWVASDGGTRNQGRAGGRADGSGREGGGVIGGVPGRAWGGGRVDGPGGGLFLA